MSATQLWRFVLSLTVAFPAIVTIIRYSKINKSYLPFVVYVVGSTFNELLVGLVLIPYFSVKETIAVDGNLYYLFESIILMTQFYYWKQFNIRRTFFLVLLAIVVIGWSVENMLVSNLYSFNIIFLISYSFILVLLSVQTINKIIVNESRIPLIKNAKFIICICMVIFFIYNIFVWILMIKGVRAVDKPLIAKIFSIQVYINALTNIIYGIAAIYIPRKKSINEKLLRNLGL